MAAHSSEDNIAYYDRLADAYPLFFDDFAVSMEAEGRWLTGILADHAARIVLDACCGTGRQAIPLARLGYHVTAVDPCAAMLRQLATLADAMHVHLRLRRARFLDLPLLFGPQFDAIVAMGNGLCHQTDRDEILASLQALRSCCRPGGIVIVGIKDFDGIRRDRIRFHPRAVADGSEERQILFEVWDFEDPLLVSTAFLLRRNADGWSMETAATAEYMLGDAELCHLALISGFSAAERISHPAEAAFVLRV